MGRNGTVLVHASNWRAVAATRAFGSTCMQMGFTLEGMNVHKGFMSVVLHRRRPDFKISRIAACLSCVSGCRIDYAEALWQVATARLKRLAHVQFQN